MLPNAATVAAMREARNGGLPSFHSVSDLMADLNAEDARFRAAVRKGIAQADQGEFIEEEEMDARIKRMLNS
jgi:predicted transcriptional regulator